MVFTSFHSCSFNVFVSFLFHKLLWIFIPLFISYLAVNLHVPLIWLIPMHTNLDSLYECFYFQSKPISECVRRWLRSVSLRPICPINRELILLLHSCRYLEESLYNWIQVNRKSCPLPSPIHILPPPLTPGFMILKIGICGLYFLISVKNLDKSGHSPATYPLLSNVMLHA